MVANITYFNTRPAGEQIGSMLMKIENVVDFSKANAAVNDTVEVLKVPAGAVIIGAGFYTLTTESSVTFTMGTESSTYANLQVATAIGAQDNFVAMQCQTLPPIPCASATTIKSIVAGANATVAKVTFYAIYAVVNAKS